MNAMRRTPRLVLLTILAVLAWHGYLAPPVRAQAARFGGIVLVESAPAPALAQETQPADADSLPGLDGGAGGADSAADDTADAGPAPPDGEPEIQAPTRPAADTRPVDLSTIHRLDDARALYDRGRYRQAERAYRKLLDANDLRLGAALGLAQTLEIQGRYGDALAALDAVGEAGAADAGWHVARARLLTTLGRYDDALAAARAALELQPRSAPAILAVGSVLEIVGRQGEAIETYRGIDRVLAGEAYRNDPDSLVALGHVMERLMILTGQRASDQAQNILGNYLQRSYLDVDRDYWPGRVAAGLFLLARHMPQSAAEELTKANEINPNIPDVAAGFAAIFLDDWEFEKAEKILAEGLEVNPNHADLHLLRAAMFLQWRKFDQAREPIEKVLEVNPNHLEALSLMVALLTRQEKPDEARPYVERIEAIHHGPYAPMHLAVGEWLSAGRQFEQAETHLRRAIEIAPELAGPWTELGLLYLQCGREDEALEALEKAHAIDNFRADVVNYINLVRDMREDFVTRETEHFIVKVHRTYDAVLLEQIALYMERIHEEICRDFEHEPADKTIIEVFPTHQGFSLRITGKGWIGTVGAATGRVIVLAAPNAERSPMFGQFNWATVLRHEYTHTVTLSATRNRIPHWFTEALAVFQQPDRRNFEAVQMLVRATRKGELFTVEEMDWGFIRPRRGGDRSLAYAQAEWTSEFIIERHGYGAILRMLEGFRDGLLQAEVFGTVLGTTEEQFNADFAAWASEQIGRWGFDPAPLPPLNQARRHAAERADDAEAQAAYARALYYEGRIDEAARAARKAVELDGREKTALGVLASLAMAQGRHDEAVRFAERLAEADPQSKLAPRVLAEVYLQRRQFAAALQQLEELKRRLPLDPWAYEQLAQLYRQLGRPDLALPNLLEINRHNLREPRWPREIAEIYRDLGQNDEALAFYGQVLEINPYDTKVYETIASLHLRARRYDEAIRYATYAAQAAPGVADSWAQLARVYFFAARTTQDRERLLEARRAAERALELDPRSPATQIRDAVAPLLEEP